MPLPALPVGASRPYRSCLRPARDPEPTDPFGFVPAPKSLFLVRAAEKRDRSRNDVQLSLRKPLPSVTSTRRSDPVGRWLSAAPINTDTVSVLITPDLTVSPLLDIGQSLSDVAVGIDPPI